MAEPHENPASVPEQPSGIFEPKPISVDMRPLTGTQKAWRFAAVIALLLLALAVFLLLKDPFMKPVNRYYKALSKRDNAAMTDAFPDFLVDAPADGETMSISEMCMTMIAQTNAQYGQDVKVKASMVSKKEVDREYLDRIQEGIRTQYHTEAEISEGLWLRLLVTYGSGKDEKETTEYVRLYRINGSWVMLDIPSNTE